MRLVNLSTVVEEGKLDAGRRRVSVESRLAAVDQLHVGDLIDRTLLILIAATHDGSHERDARAEATAEGLALTQRVIQRRRARGKLKPQVGRARPGSRVGLANVFVACPLAEEVAVRQPRAERVGIAEVAVEQVHLREHMATGP
eukprot:3138678-Prymnesium_polylepis.1